MIQRRQKQVLKTSRIKRGTKRAKKMRKQGQKTPIIRIKEGDKIDQKRGHEKAKIRKKVTQKMKQTNSREKKRQNMKTCR